jgi:hypothetical protein
MRCDRALSSFATGGAFRQWRARRHAARCPACAGELARLKWIVKELESVEPLTSAQRSLWASISTEDRPVVSRPAWGRRPALVAGMSTVVVIGIGLAIVVLRPLRATKPTVERPGLAVVNALEARRQASPAVIRELDALKSKFQALSQELVQLRLRAELLDERRDAESLSHRFERPLALNGP